MFPASDAAGRKAVTLRQALQQDGLTLSDPLVPPPVGGLHEPKLSGPGGSSKSRSLRERGVIGDARLSGAVRSEEEGLCQSRALATTKPMLGAVQHVLSKQDQTIEPVLDRERELKVLQIGGEVRAEPGDT